MTVKWEDNLRAMLVSGAEQLGVALTEMQANGFRVYLEELLRWNAKFNLTSITDPREIVVKHFLDSLSLARLLPTGPFRAADIGAGAGFPGLPLAMITPRMEITLVEPAHRKAAFIRHIARTLKLVEISVEEEKVERLEEKYTGRFDVIFSRAFKEPGELIALAGPLVAEGGRFALSAGPETDIAPPAGWAIARMEEVVLPYSDIRRRLVEYGRG